MGKNAIIIGGSIGGLMSGIMLKHHGYTVTILEKSDLVARSSFDAGLSIRDEVLAFLAKHDRVKRDMLISCPPGSSISLDGKPSAQRGQTVTLTSWALLVHVLRANFDGRISDAVPVAPGWREGDGQGAYVSNALVLGLKDVGEKVEVVYEDGEGRNVELVADIVVVSDGSNSSMRKILVPGLERQYAGYMLWRGTTREELVDPKWNELYSAKSTFCFQKGHYLLNYTIPTDDGDLTPGKRLHNWVWYQNFAADSPELATLFTDVNGKQHFGTLPRGLVKPEAWEKQKELAAATLPEGIAEIVKRTTWPFVTKVFDVASPRALFMGGKVFMIGDAQTTIRSNVGLGSTHAAYDCAALEQVVERVITAEQWEKVVLRYAAKKSRFAFAVSSWGLGSKIAVLWNVLRYLMILLGQRVGVC